MDNKGTRVGLSGNHFKVGHSLDEGGLESVAPGMGAVELPDTPQLETVSSTGEFPEEPVVVKGAGRLIFKSLYDASDSGGAEVRFKLYDYNGQLIGFTDKYTINNIGLQDSNGNYVGTLLVLANEMGAQSISVQVVKAPSGSLSMYISKI